MAKTPIKTVKTELHEAEAQTCSFGTVIEMLRMGRKATRIGWNGKGQMIELQVPDTNSKMTKPYIFINTVDGHKIPWAPSQTDVLEEDWLIIG